MWVVALGRRRRHVMGLEMGWTHRKCGRTDRLGGFGRKVQSEGMQGGVSRRGGTTGLRWSIGYFTCSMYDAERRLVFPPERHSGGCTMAAAYLRYDICMFVCTHVTISLVSHVST